MCKLVSLELQKKPPVTLDHFPQELQHDGRVRNQPGFKPPDRSAMLDVLSQLYTDKSYFEAILRDLGKFVSFMLNCHSNILPGTGQRYT